MFVIRYHCIENRTNNECILFRETERLFKIACAALFKFNSAIVFICIFKCANARIDWYHCLINKARHSPNLPSDPSLPTKTRTPRDTHDLVPHNIGHLDLSSKYLMLYSCCQDAEIDSKNVIR